MPEPGSWHRDGDRPRSGGRSTLARASPFTEPEGFPVVGIGASSGGLEACTKLVEAIQAESGMAFIIVQHLEPNHASMMVDLLATHTSMAVQEAAEGLRLEPDHLYVIPPGRYLSLLQGTLHLTEPQTQRGARLPFDVLLHSLAQNCGQRAIGVILSGTWGRRQPGARRHQGKRWPRRRAGPARSRLRRHAEKRHRNGVGRPRAASGQDRRGTPSSQPRRRSARVLGCHPRAASLDRSTLGDHRTPAAADLA